MSKSVTISMASKDELRVTKISKYVVVQYAWRHLKGSQKHGAYRLSIKARGNTAHEVTEAVRRLKGWSFVFETETGMLLWENTPTEWPALETAIRNHEAIKEV